MADDGCQLCQRLGFLQSIGNPAGRADAHSRPIAIAAVSRCLVGQEPAAEQAAKTGVGIFPAPVAELTPQGFDIAAAGCLPIHQGCRYGYSRHRIIGKTAVFNE